MRIVITSAIISIILISGLGSNLAAIGEIENVIIDEIQFSQLLYFEDENFLSIEVENANSNYWVTGKPLLPALNRVFTFPFGTKITSVEVDFSEKIVEQISKPVKPAPEAYSISIVKQSAITNDQNHISYSELEFYPEQQFSWKTYAGKNGKDHVIFCAISMVPVQYFPNEDKIVSYRSANIRISYIPPTIPINFPEKYDLLIITPSEFNSTLQRLADHKIQRDISTKIVTLDEIPNQGIDIQESIKLYIKYAIESWGVDYLILVGSGYEEVPKFPIRYAWIDDSIEDNFPSDLYYADIYNSTMGFSDWDFDNDGKYAEYPDDIYYIDIAPDIYLGKIPCDTVDELNAYIDKVIYYDKHNKMTNRIVQVGGDTFTSDSEGIFEGEYANEQVLQKLPGYNTIELWASKNRLSKLNIALGYRLLPDFYDFSGHGSYKSWATHPPDDHLNWIPKNSTISKAPGWQYYDFDIYLVKNSKKYPIVFYNSCSSNKFQRFKDCLSWKTIRKPDGGGIIAYGSSGIAKASSGTYITKRLFGWMEVHTFEELYITKNLGEVWSNCIKDYQTTFESTLSKSDFKTLLEFSMFGDPTLNADDGDDPRVKPYITQNTRFFNIIIQHFPFFKKLLYIF
jgi:hypothetical protein